MLKKLVMEFKDELDALGVKVDTIDKRVAVLEDNLGGWKLRGQFFFDANFAGGQDNNKTAYTANGKQTTFQKDRFRLTLTKQIDENTSFYSQFRAGSNTAHENGMGDMSFRVRQAYVDTKLPYDIGFRVGRFFVDPEDDHGLYVDNDAIFGDYRVDGFQFAKSWGNFSAKAVIGRNSPLEGSFEGNFMNYVVDLTWQPNEKFFGGIGANWMNGDEGVADRFGINLKTYDVYASFNFTPAIALQGIYYWQNIDVDNGMLAAVGIDDNAKAWKAILDIKQDALKFTGLRFEYQQQDNNFVGPRDPYSFGKDAANAATIAANMPINNNTTKFFFVYATQKWNDKWSSYLRYQHADFDTTGIDDAKGYGVGVTYQYTPAMAFRLAYDNVDYGDNNGRCAMNGKDHVVQFRTTVNF